MHPSCKIHQLTSEDMKFAARGLLYLPPTNEDYLHVSPSQVLTDGTGPPDAFIAFRGLFRASHAWPRHDSLTQLFNTMLKRSGYRTRLEVQVPNAGSRGRVDIVAYGLFHNTDSPLTSPSQQLTPSTPSPRHPPRWALPPRSERA